MDFTAYYLNQAGKGLPYYQGLAFQKGFGLGGIFRNIFKWIMPIVKEHAFPIVKKVGKELLKTAANVATDTIDGQNITNSAKERFSETFKNLKNKIHEGEGLILKPGLGIKRKAKRKSNAPKKKRIDIFNKK